MAASTYKIIELVGTSNTSAISKSLIRINLGTE